jgi:hypothetical protein
MKSNDWHNSVESLLDIEEVLNYDGGVLSQRAV